MLYSIHIQTPTSTSFISNLQKTAKNDNFDVYLLEGVKEYIMRRAIICGYGQLGQAIAKELKQENIQVYGICRSNKSDPYATIIASDIFESNFSKLSA